MELQYGELVNYLNTNEQSEISWSNESKWSYSNYNNNFVITGNLNSATIEFSLNENELLSNVNVRKLIKESKEDVMNSINSFKQILF